jgi:radical SAM protein with 4Fe4S-binding SPASM domain
MAALQPLAFKHVTSNGYVHAYRNGTVTALYNSVNLNAAFVRDVPENALDVYSSDRLAAADVERLHELGLDLRSGWHGAAQLINGLQARAVSEGITTVYFIPAMACNYRCKYCEFIQEFPETAHYQKMSTVQARELVDTYYQMSASASPRSRDFVFFGGEPFMAADIILDVLKYIREDRGDQDINITTFTNGSLITDEIAAACARYNVYAIVSMDGPAEVNDLARVDLNFNPSTQRTIRGYRKLQDAGCRMGISIMVGRHNVDSLAQSVRWLINELKPDEIGIAGVFHPLKRRKNPFQAEAERVISALVETYIACREQGVYVDQVARRMRPFVSMRPKLKDCMACGGKVTATPWGMEGHCEYIAYVKGSAKRDLVQIEIEGNDDESWNRRSPVLKMDCQNCPALGVCGGGCPYNAFQLHGNLDALDEENCDQTRLLLAWMLEDLYKVCERRSGLAAPNVLFPTAIDREALFGSIDPTDESLPLKGISRHGE